MKKKKVKQEVQKIVAIPLKDIVPSETNPRDEFPATGLKELAESIEQQGQLQAIIVRPGKKAGKYEIVAGERRYRAMNQYVTGAKTINAVVRKLNDEEALEVQVIENLQREDVHPLAEAQAFATLLKKKSIDVVAGIIGKSESYILKRLKLNDLIPEAKKMYTKGTMAYGHALHICRIPKEEQKKAVDWMEEESYGPDQIVTVNELKEHIESDIMLKMENAPWDLKDKNLYPAAGACSTCPKRTSCNKLLFDDMAPKDDLCTDAVCFAKKKELHIANAFIKLRGEGIDKPVSAEDAQQWNNGATVEDVKIGNKQYPVIRKTECDYTEPVVLTKVSQYSGAKKKIGAILYICRDEKCKKHYKPVKKEKPNKKQAEQKAQYEQKQKDLERRKACDEVLFKDLMLKKEMPIYPEELNIIIREQLIKNYDVTSRILSYHALLKVSKRELEETGAESEEEALYQALESKFEALCDNADGMADDDKEAAKAIKTLDELLTALIKKYKHPIHLLRLIYAWNAKGDERTESNFLFEAIRSLGFDPEEAEKKFNVDWEKANALKAESVAPDAEDVEEEEEFSEDEA